MAHDGALARASPFAKQKLGEDEVGAVVLVKILALRLTFVARKDWDLEEAGQFEPRGRIVLAAFKDLGAYEVAIDIKENNPGQKKVTSQSPGDRFEKRI